MYSPFSSDAETGQAAPHFLLTERGSEPFLIHELRRAYPSGLHRVRSPGLVESDFILQPEAPPVLVFSRQLLPDAQACAAESINGWAQQLLTAVLSLPDGQRWHLHVLPHYGFGIAGQNRCGLIYKALVELLRRKHRLLLKTLQETPTVFTAADTIVQLLLTAPNAGFISVAAAPIPHQLRRILWPFRNGEVPVASDKSAPSRAFAKLIEAEQRLGRLIAAGETCVDLGASPGSWSYVALKRGARVMAVDRAPLREDLMKDPRLAFQKGDAFSFDPETPVDWLLCDVIAAPERTIELLLRWVQKRQAAHFVVTIKFKGTHEYGMLERLKYALPPLCDDFYLLRLSANRNEVCAFGTVRKDQAAEPGAS